MNEALTGLGRHEGEWLIGVWRDTTLGSRERDEIKWNKSEKTVFIQLKNIMQKM